MQGSIEQFMFLILGAFAVILVLIFASQPWAHAERTPILALLVAAAALLWSGANTFFTFFWHFSDFRVYLTFPKPEQVGTNTLDVNYFFSNMGNQTVLIQDIEIDDLWIKSADPGLVGGDLNRCDDRDLLLPTFATFERWAPSQTWEEHKPIWPSRIGPNTKPKEGVLLAVLKPTKIYIDGSEVKTASVTVETGKMKLISATFETTPLPIENYETAVVCPVIRLFDNEGLPVLAVCKGSQFSHPSPPSVATPEGIVGRAPLSERLVRLLPISSKGNCQILAPQTRRF
jgi:hypothetical protein